MSTVIRNLSLENLRNAVETLSEYEQEKPLPEEEIGSEPINVIYQTAEDGLDGFHLGMRLAVEALFD